MPDRLLRMVCSAHGIISETTWTEEEMASDDVRLHVEHVSRAHREPYGRGCTTSTINVQLFDGDRAPVFIAWGVSAVPAQKVFMDVFATEADFEAWREQQRDERFAHYEVQEANVLHYVQDVEPDEGAAE